VQQAVRWVTDDVNAQSEAMRMRSGVQVGSMAHIDIKNF
jgi:hypothetical protein